MIDVFVEVVGWLGTLAILIAYFLLSIHLVKAHSREYQLLNFFGALGIIINSSVHRAVPSVVLNVVWSLIALYSLMKIVRKD